MKSNTILFAFVVLCMSVIPMHASYAAFSTAPFSSNGDGKAYTKTQAPVYSVTNGFALAALVSSYSGVYDNTNPVTACQAVLASSGLSESVDTYCVYDATESGPNIGGAYWGSGGVGTGCTNFAGCLGNPAAPGTGHWPPNPAFNSEDYSYAFKNPSVYVYQSPLQQQNLSGMPLNAYASGDVCPDSHSDRRDQATYYAVGNVVSAYGPAAACNIYFHQGAVAKPVATLTANPSTIVSGNSSLLTYSCTNGATSASIDNGVGALSPPSAGPKSVSPTTTTTYTLTCTNASGSSTASATVTVTPIPTFPDLTASIVSPVSPTAGIPVMLSATIFNGGNAATGIGFTDLFQRANDPSGSGAVDIGTAANAALANGASNPASLLYPFPSAGTFYVRVCADKSSAGDAVGVIPEGNNEGNNCSPTWTAITVAPVVIPPPPTPTCTFSASSPTLPSNLTWSSTNATKCTGGGFNTGNATSGTVPAPASGPYTLSCDNGTTSCTTQIVTVGGAACTMPTLALTAQDPRVRPNTTTVVTYNATGVASCTLTGPGAPPIIPNACMAQGTFTTPAISQQTIYTLTCDGVSKQLIINVLPNITEF